MTRRSAAIGAVVAAVAVVAGSLVPAQQRSMLHSHGRLHPWFHLGIFGALGLLVWRGAAGTGARLALLLALMFLGGATEFAESYFYGGPLELEDMLVDAAGVLLGAGAGWLLQRRDRADDGGDYRIE